MVVGYSAENPDQVDRLPAKGVVHYEKYTDYSPKDIDEIYAEKESLPETKKLLEENQLETLAQIFTQNRYKKADNLHFSKVLLKVLEQQGFMNNS